MAKEIQMCRASSSISSVIGNTSFIIRNFVTGLFPKGFFKHVHIDTRMTQADQDDQEDVYKREKPILVIRPRFSLDDNHVFGKLPDWMSTNYFLFKQLQDNYSPVFYDEKKQIYIYTVPDRVKITFEIEIICNTRMQQLNAAYYLKGSVLHKSYFYLEEETLECEIPKYFIKVLSEHMGYDMRYPAQKQEFLTYLDTGSQSFITEKVKASSGRPAYFYAYQTNLLCLFPENPQVDDGEQKDMLMENFRITNSLEVEFWVHTNYFLETNTLEVAPPPVDDEDMMDVVGDKVVMNFTMNFNYPSMEEDGLALLRKQGYITDDADIDVLPLDEFLPYEYKHVIKYNNKYNISNEDYFTIRVFREHLEVNPDKVTVDWENLTLSSLKPLPNTTYHLVLYGDKDKINKTFYRIKQITGEIYHDE